MVLVQNGIKFCLFLFLTNIISANAAARSSRNSDFLDKLLNVKKQAPVVVFLQQSRDGIKITDRYGNDVDDSQQIEDERNKQVNHNQVDGNDYIDNTEVKYAPSRGENDAYVLYSIFRSTIEEEELDPKAASVIKTTQEVLRQAFDLRCQARSSCEKKCPQSCRTECEETKTKRPCPKKKRITPQQSCMTVCKPKASHCADNCIKIYDELDACDEPEKKQNTHNGSYGSKTRPPRW